jgi:hypothetical protein
MYMKVKVEHCLTWFDPRLVQVLHCGPYMQMPLESAERTLNKIPIKG